MSHRTTAVVFAALLIALPVSPVAASQDDSSQLDGSIDSREEAVLFARNVAEVKGHLYAAVRLAGDLQPVEAEFHAEHAYTDYWTAGSTRGPVGPAITNANESLAAELEIALAGLEANATALGPEEFERRVLEDVFPLLDRVLDETIPPEYSERPDFDVRVMNALLERTDEEYNGEITPEGAVDQYREYWDARGFIVQATNQYESTIAPTLDREARTETDALFAELQALASLQAPSPELEAVTADLRSTLSGATNGTTEGTETTTAS